VLAGFGFGAFVFNFVATAVCNPDNLEPDDSGYLPISVGNNVPKMIKVLCACWAGLTIIGIAMIFPYKVENLVEPKNLN
jgi:hypothetical protein